MALKIEFFMNIVCLYHLGHFIKTEPIITLSPLEINHFSSLLPSRSNRSTAIQIVPIYIR